MDQVTSSKWRRCASCSRQARGSTGAGVDPARNTCSWSERRCRYIASDVVSLFLHSPQWTRWVWGRALADASPDLLTDHLAPLCGPPVGLAPQWRLHGSTAASSSASPPLPAAAAAAAALLHKPQQPRALTAVRPAFHHRMQYVTLGRIGEGT